MGVDVSGDPVIGFAVHGDPADDHVVTILEKGRTEVLQVRGIFGNAIAFYRDLDRLLALIRSAAVPPEPADESAERQNLGASTETEAAGGGKAAEHAQIEPEGA